MPPVTEAQARRIGVVMSAMARRGRRHALDVAAEKGPWDGQDPTERAGMIIHRLSQLELLRLGQAVPPNDDGSPRAIEDEFAKLACSLGIYGDLIGALGDTRPLDPLVQLPHPERLGWG